ncbi:TolC family protein [Sulfurimonas sp. SAG-AH-194-I05]|nr:TolC family protein [Sulfurimonas sp. SAG-AH-194-I05]MDF1874536.1 TolC family protein [Sulfurimonas sp. SAG-AH-194-I05]
MKVLNLYSLLLVVSSSLLLGEGITTTLDDYISENKKQQFDYDYKNNKTQSSLLRDSWISPINIQYTYSKSNQFDVVGFNESAAIRIDQALFQSGGIFYAIKFANASEKYNNLSIDTAKRKMIKDTVSLLMQIKQTDLKIQKQNLKIKNAQINLELKKEQYLTGQLDSGFLDNAIIEKNTITQALYDIETSKQGLISTFKTLSDLEYETTAIPHLNFIKKEDFLKNNLRIDVAKMQIQKDLHNQDVTLAKYLPKINVTAGYNWSNSDSPFNFGKNEKKYYDYGFRVVLPISISTLDEIQVAKVSYLKSKRVVIDKEKEVLAIFEQVIQNIDNIDRKKSLSLENKNLYSKLLADTKELFTAGYKTSYDVSLLENSFIIAGIDEKIYELDKQLELLTLYEMYSHE